MIRFLTWCAILSFIYNLNSADINSTQYFQQHVKYKIDATLDINLNRINATQILVYTNNSPDTLRELHFHLYLNKYRRNAYQENGLRQRETGSIEIFKIVQADSMDVVFFTDHTLLILKLNERLLPEDSVKLKFDFASRLPPASGRYGYYGNHYDVGNWFPTPVVYDQAGWHLNQHIDNEFYQEWGDFEVNITVPKGFILGATGDLLNPGECMSDTAKAIKKAFYESDNDTLTTTWKYKAQNVHDFAWTADPDYVLFQNNWQGITINVLAMEHNAAEWKQVADFGKDALIFLSERFGYYPYNQISIADTYIRAGGIEYPQITFINTYTSPLYALNHFRAVIIHEMAHNWYYGLLANNQTEFEWLDEGFTTMAEVLCMEHLFGSEDNYSYNAAQGLAGLFHVPVSMRRANALEYLEQVKSGREFDPVNTFPDRFRGEGYISSYNKMSHILFMLQNVLGDSVFFNSLITYFNTWKFKHPYPKDFIKIMEEVSGRDLKWFFDQWLYSTRLLDYAVGDVRGEWIQEEGNSTYHTRIELRNLGDIFMPLDIDVYMENGTVKRYHIPVDAVGKETDDREIKQQWHFTQNRYNLETVLNDKPGVVVVDPQNILLDVNRLNNRSGFLPQMHFYFMKPQSYHPPLDSYLWEGWPQVFYNDIDFIKVGFLMKGSYLDLDHRLRLKFWLKTATGGADLDFYYTHPIGIPVENMELELRAYILDGVRGGKIGLCRELSKSYQYGNETRIGIYAQFSNSYDNKYRLDAWSKGTLNSFNMYFIKRHREDLIELLYQSSILGSDHQFNTALFNADMNLSIDRYSTGLRCRFSGGYSEGDIPRQFLYKLSGSRGWDNFFNPFYRSRGSLPYPWYKSGNLYQNRYAGVRGSSLNADHLLFMGNKFISLNLDYHFHNPFEYSFLYLLRDLQPLIFTDFGAAWNSEFPKYSDFVKSAGLGLRYDRLWPLDRFSKLEYLQFDFPIWMSHSPGDENNWKIRWLFHVGMSL